MDSLLQHCLVWSVVVFASVSLINSALALHTMFISLTPTQHLCWSRLALVQPLAMATMGWMQSNVGDAVEELLWPWVANWPLHLQQDLKEHAEELAQRAKDQDEVQKEKAAIPEQAAGKNGKQQHHLVKQHVKQLNIKIKNINTKLKQHLKFQKEMSAHHAKKIKAVKAFACQYLTRLTNDKHKLFDVKKALVMVKKTLKDLTAKQPQP